MKKENKLTKDDIASQLTSTLDKLESVQKTIAALEKMT